MGEEGWTALPGRWGLGRKGLVTGNPGPEPWKCHAVIPELLDRTGTQQEHVEGTEKRPWREVPGASALSVCWGPAAEGTPLGRVAA